MACLNINWVYVFSLHQNTLKISQTATGPWTLLLILMSEFSCETGRISGFYCSSDFMSTSRMHGSCFSITFGYRFGLLISTLCLILKKCVDPHPLVMNMNEFGRWVKYVSCSVFILSSFYLSNYLFIYLTLLIFSFFLWISCPVYIFFLKKTSVFLVSVPY